MKRLALLLSLTLVACGSDDGNSESANAESTDMDVVNNLQVGDAGIVDAGGDGGESEDTGSSGDMGSESLNETEPNDGSTATEFNDLPTDATVVGNISSEDVDIFSVPTQAGTLYTVEIDLPDGSELQPHLTVLDSGRDGDQAGQDYVKIVRGNRIQFLGMGTGHLIIVRDARNVDGEAVGGEGFGYSLRVSGADAAENTAGMLSFGSELSGTLEQSGDVDLWSFDGTEGTFVTLDMNSPNGDGRLWIYASATGDWIARQDDRTLDNPNPLLDAPLSESGPMFLVVETITEDAPNITYTIQTATQ